MLDIPDEVWKPIAGYEGIYEVSDKGRVKSLGRNVPYRDGFRVRKEKILKPNTISDGYSQVTLQKMKTRKQFLVHRLVAQSFLPNERNLPQVNHKDGNRLNNDVRNLEWCTAKENMVHSVETWLRSDLRPVEAYTKDGEHVRTFQSIHKAERETGVWRANIRKSCKSSCLAGGFIWKYSEKAVRI